MKRSQAFQSNYMGKEDVHTVQLCTIKGVSMEVIKSDEGDREKPVMYFGNGHKPLILNNINWITLEDVWGDESDNWVGKSIECFLDPNVMFGSKRVGGVRVRIPSGPRSPRTAPQQQQAAPALAGPAPLSWEQVLAQCSTVEISKEQLVEHLKQSGRTGYNAARDTAMVLRLIEDTKRANAPAIGDEPQFTDSDITF